MKWLKFAWLTLCFLALISQTSLLGQGEKKADSKKGLPLETDRKVHLKTSEGTWMNIDVSPDGRSIAFDLMGDLYLLPF